MTSYFVAAALGVVAGVMSGLFGVGGGILFVPILTWVGLTQLHAEASSLLAIIPTVLVGVWRQQRYGNVRWRAAAVLGVASIAATVGGAQLALSLPESTLRKLFAVLLICTAGQIAWRARRQQP
jgi:Predicted permeases